MAGCVATMRGQAQRLVDSAWTTRTRRQLPVCDDERHLDLRASLYRETVAQARASVVEEEFQALAPACLRQLRQAAETRERASPAPLPEFKNDDREICPEVWRRLLDAAAAQELVEEPLSLRLALRNGAAARRPPRALSAWMLVELCRQTRSAILPHDRWDGAALACSESKHAGDAVMQKPCPHDPEKRSRRTFRAAQRLSRAGRGESELLTAVRPVRKLLQFPLEEPCALHARQAQAREILGAALSKRSGLEDDKQLELALDRLAEPLERAAENLAADAPCGLREARLCCAAWGAQRLRRTQRALEQLSELLDGDVLDPEIYDVDAEEASGYRVGEEVLVRCEVRWRVESSLDDGGELVLRGDCTAPHIRGAGRLRLRTREDGPWLDARLDAFLPGGMKVRCSGARALARGQEIVTRSEEEPGVLTRVEHGGRLEVKTRVGVRWRSARWGGGAPAAYNLFSCRSAGQPATLRSSDFSRPPAARPLVLCGAQPGDRVAVGDGAPEATVLQSLAGSARGCRDLGLLRGPLRSASEGVGVYRPDAPAGRLCCCATPCESCPRGLIWDEVPSRTKRNRRDEELLRDPAKALPAWKECHVLSPGALRQDPPPPECGWAQSFLEDLPAVLWEGSCSRAWRRAARCDDGPPCSAEARDACACVSGLLDRIRAALWLRTPAVSPGTLRLARRAVEQELECSDTATLVKQAWLDVAPRSARLEAWARREQRLLLKLQGEEGGLVARRAILPLPAAAASLVREIRCAVEGCDGVMLAATRQDRAADEEGTAVLVCCSCGYLELERRHRAQ